MALWHLDRIFYYRSIKLGISIKGNKLFKIRKQVKAKWLLEFARMSHLSGSILVKYVLWPDYYIRVFYFWYLYTSEHFKITPSYIQLNVSPSKMSPWVPLMRQSDLHIYSVTRCIRILQRNRTYVTKYGLCIYLYLGL